MISIDDPYTRLEVALEAGGIAWWEMEMPTGVVFFSDNKAKLLGRKASDFTHYTDFTNLIHPDDYEASMRSMTDHLEGKASMYESRYRIRHSDGSYVTFYDRGKIVAKKDGETLVAGIVIDVTSRKDFI